MSEVLRLCLILLGMCCHVALANAATEDPHYILKRAVYRLELVGTPLARILCTARDPNSGASDTVVWDPQERRSPVRYALLPSKEPTLAGVPEISCRSEQVLVDGGARPDTALWYVQARTSDSAAPVPAAAAPAAAAAPELDEGNNSWSVTLSLKTASPADGPQLPSADPSLSVTVTLVEGKEKTRVLDQLNDGIQTSRLRSLDPTTTLVTDALTALATVALDRAENAGKEYARRLMRESLCENLTVRTVTDGLEGSLLAVILRELNWPPEQRLLRNTCALIETLRIDELVSAKDALWKAVGVDAATLAAAFLGENLGAVKEARLGEIVQSLSGVVHNALTTGSTTTERDAQVLVLTLARIGVYEQHGVVDKGDWQYALELGMAVLQDCLRAGECSADQLERLLEQEIDLDDADDVREWAALPGILGRAASVLRPPPGTSPAVTAANAVSVALDIVELAFSQVELPDDTFTICLSQEDAKRRGFTHRATADICEDSSAKRYVPQSVHVPVALYTAIKDFKAGNGRCATLEESEWAKVHLGTTATNTLEAWTKGCSLKEYDSTQLMKILPKLKDEILDIGWKRPIERALGLVRTLRGIVAALQGGEVTAAVVDLGKVFESAIVDECARQGDQRCSLPVTSSQLKKGFRILTGLATYGASYRKADANEEPGEIEKLRAEERQKAVESLIDAVTDRSERYRDTIWSLGANVAFTGDYRVVGKGGDDSPNYVNKVPLSLPMGVAFQWLPNEGTTFLGKPGVHVMLSVIDLMQFATLGGEESNESDDTTTNPPPGPGEMSTEEPEDDLDPPDAEFTSALRLGLQVGMLLGEPSYPIALSGHAAWIPRVDYGEFPRQEWSVGVSLGVFVPFIDFN